MNFKNLIYSIACLSFSVVIGAAIYEHLAVVPRWAAGPPASLSMFQGDYGLYAQAFWIPIHPITLTLLLLTLIISWKSPRRTNVLTNLIGYVAILVITSIYFVPELIAITTTPYSDTVDAALTERAEKWEMLSLVRLGFLIILSLILFMGLTRSNRRGY
jgi:hypothetical protein